MKCNSCGYENNKDGAKFCSKCGASLSSPKPSAENNGSSGENSNSSSSKIIIAVLVVIIVVLAGFVSYAMFNATSGDVQGSGGSSQSIPADSDDDSSDKSAKTESVSSSKSESKSWELIGEYSGSGSGSQVIDVPAGQIMVKISAYPIKNYATNHLYAKGSNGKSAGVDWGSTSDVETRSDSVTYTSSSSETFTIDYYETVSWQVEFYRYQ